mgnify:FL=1
MAEWHLIDLRNALQRKKWQVFTCLKGNDYDGSGIWQIQRPDGTEKRHIEFDGLDDMETLSLEASYGCKVRELPGCKLYFHRKGSAWKQQLVEFVDRLSQLSDGQI